MRECFVFASKLVTSGVRLIIFDMMVFLKLFEFKGQVVAINWKHELNAAFWLALIFFFLLI